MSLTKQITKHNSFRVTTSNGVMYSLLSTLDWLFWCSIDLLTLYISLGSWLGWCGKGSVVFSFLGCFLLFQVFRKELFVSNMSLNASLKLILLDLLVDNLSSDSLFSDKSLYLWCFVESFFGISLSFFNFSSNNVLSHIILLSKNKGLSDSVCSFWTESSWSLVVGEAFDFAFSLNEHFESDNSKIWSANASSN